MTIHATVYLTDDGIENILVSADEPARFDICRHISGELLVYAYQGTEIDMDQEPYFAVDGLYPPEPDTTTDRLTVVAKEGGDDD